MMNDRKLEKYLLKIGIPQEDIKQTIEAGHIVKIYRAGTRIGRDSAMCFLGLRKYWMVLNRAAFHWTASAMDSQQREYLFDCRSYFREPPK